MKKSILITLCFVGFGIFTMDAQKQSLSKKDAKKIADEINLSLDNLTVSIDNIDWKAMGKLLDQAVIAVDQNADAMTEIAKNIDMDKVTANLEKVVKQIGNSVDNENLEKQLKEIGEKLEKVMSEAGEKK